MYKLGMGAPHSAVLNFDQLWISLMISSYYKKKHLWWRLRATHMCRYKDSSLEWSWEYIGLGMYPCWLVLCNIDTRLSHLRGGNLNREKASRRSDFKQTSLISLISDWWPELSQFLDSATPELVFLSSVRNQAEQARSSNPVSSTIPCTVHLLLTVGSCPIWVKILISFDNEQCWENMFE